MKAGGLFFSAAIVKMDNFLVLAPIISAAPVLINTGDLTTITAEPAVHNSSCHCKCIWMTF
jgi:hypothetical protein